MTNEEMIAEATALREKDNRITSVTFYHDGWLPNCYRWRADGNRTTVDVSGEFIKTVHGIYDRKRSYGQGPAVVAYSAKGGRLYSR